jgi:hypothetical protein
LVTLLASGGRKFFEVADIVLGNADPLGDGLVDLSGQANKVGVVSTVTREFDSDGSPGQLNGGEFDFGEGAVGTWCSFTVGANGYPH